MIVKIIWGGILFDLGIGVKLGLTSHDHHYNVDEIFHT